MPKPTTPAVPQEYGVAINSGDSAQIVYLNKEQTDILLSDLVSSANLLDVPAGAFLSARSAEGTDAMTEFNKQAKGLRKLSNKYKDHISNSTAVLLSQATENTVATDKNSADMIS